jgi:hypothetical protein
MEILYSVEFESQLAVTNGNTHTAGKPTRPTIPANEEDECGIRC